MTGSTITLNHNGATSVGSLRIFNNEAPALLVINAAGTAKLVTLGLNTTLANLTITSGTLSLSGNTLILTGVVNVDITNGTLQGSATSKLTFGPGSSAVGPLTFTTGAGSSLNTLTMNQTTSTLIPVASTLTIATLTLTIGSLQFASGIKAIVTTLNGGNPSSFIDGALARVTATGAATTFFPIGKTSFYRPLTLTATAQAAASTYTAEQFEGNPSRTLAAGNGLGTAPLLRVSTKRFYTVTSSNVTPGNFAGTITVSFGSDDYVNVPSDPDLVIAKRDATGPNANAWTNLGSSANTGAGSGPGGVPVAGTLTSASFSDFSDFVLGAQNDLTNVNFFQAINPLPVELTAFSAQRQADKSVSVKWATASEKNSARFEVQRSLDGREYVTVATAAAQGSSTQATAYAALDKAAPAGRLYYRLRQVDQNGTAAFSPVVLVAGSGETIKVALYPNPAHSRLSFLAEGAMPYRVLNQLGQPLLQGTAQAGTASIAIEALPTGLYFLELQTAAGRQVQKFEKE